MARKNNNDDFKFNLTAYWRRPGSDFRDTWQVFRIISEFIDGYNFITNLHNEVTVFGSARTKKTSKYYRMAVELGRMLGDAGYTVVTGGGPGIMEAANKGAWEAGGQSVGLNIQLPKEQRINRYVKDSVAFSYFFIRKVMLLSAGHAFVFFPGGFGTLDEFFEALDGIETGLFEDTPLIVVGSEFWNPLIEGFLKNKSVKQVHSLDESDLRYIQIVDNAEEAFRVIKKNKRKYNMSHKKRHIIRQQKINWQIFKIMADIVDGLEMLSKIDRDITILGTKNIYHSDSFYYTSAYNLGKKLAKKGYTIVTGGGSGIMEAANKGAWEAGGKSIGLYTDIADQGPVNRYLTDSLAFDFPYIRKLILTAPSYAFVLFPGGFGTLDQCFEVLTLVQTEKMPQVPVVLFGSDYWSPLVKFLKKNVFEDKHAISRFDLKLFKVVDDVDEVIRIISKHKRV